MNWYEKCIEPYIRSLVRLLRDNGINTESSCGHDMTVYCQIITDGFIQHVDNLLFNEGYRNYTIEINIDRVDGHEYSSMKISLKQPGAAR
jgi:hypothetical protein